MFKFMVIIPTFTPPVLALVPSSKVIANSVKEDGTISDIIGGTGVQDRLWH